MYDHHVCLWVLNSTIWKPPEDITCSNEKMKGYAWLMKKILLNGLDGNFGRKAAEILLKRHPHKDLIFTAPTEKGLTKYREMGIDTRIADFHAPDKLAETFKGADTVILISMPFVGPRRRTAHKTAIDAAVNAGVRKLVYTSIVGAGHKDIDTYEVNLQLPKFILKDKAEDKCKIGDSLINCSGCFLDLICRYPLAKSR